MSPIGPRYDRLSVGSSVEWYTPPEIFEALGLDFDLDPAAPPGGVPWIPARRSLCCADDGLSQPWEGRVWCNPPYGAATGQWLTRLAEHGDGLALVFARTETAWWRAALARATAICFVAGRIRFIDGTTGTPGPNTASTPSALIAFGMVCAMALIESGLGLTLLVPRGSPVPEVDGTPARRRSTRSSCRPLPPSTTEV